MRAESLVEQEPLIEENSPSGAATPLTAYSVLIRTYNSAGVLPVTLAALSRQTHPPSEYVCVDSGSTDGTVSLLPPGTKTHRFAGAEFNYADALNQGLAHVSNELVLILSSHAVVSHPRTLEVAVRLLESDEKVGAAYVSSDTTEPLRFEMIHPSNFTGFNGIFNTCSIVKTSLLRRRAFRRAVFTAEDQEWTRWLLFEEGKTVARLLGAGMVNNNPRKNSIRKRLNEYVAVAYFANRDLLGWRNLCRIAGRIFFPGRWPALRERVFHAMLLGRLLACRFAAPRARSRYY
jgi:glycosyltransferase involved in cell wall biosynthesis